MNPESDNFPNNDPCPIDGCDGHLYVSHEDLRRCGCIDMEYLNCDTCGYACLSQYEWCDCEDEDDLDYYESDFDYFGYESDDYPDYDPDLDFGFEFDPYEAHNDDQD